MNQGSRNQPLCDMFLLPLLSNLGNKRDSLQSLFSDISVVALWPVPLPLELKRGILVNWNNDSMVVNTALYSQLPGYRKQRAQYLRHVLATQAPVCFRPFNLTRIPLHLEILVAFRSAKAKDLTSRHTIWLQINTQIQAQTWLNEVKEITSNVWIITKE